MTVHTLYVTCWVDQVFSGVMHFGASDGMHAGLGKLNDKISIRHMSIVTGDTTRLGAAKDHEPLRSNGSVGAMAAFAAVVTDSCPCDVV